MKEEIELGWLALADGSRLILTSFYVLHHQDKGAFGDHHEMLPLRGITTLRLSWRRSRALLALGVLLLVIFVLLLASTLTVAPGEQSLAQRLLNLSARTLFAVQYGALAGALLSFVGFWFYKLNDLQIMASTGSVGGTPRSYEDAQNFCSLVISELTGNSAPALERRKEPAPAPKTPSTPKTADPDWQL
jgi:hypothetical protein